MVRAVTTWEKIGLIVELASRVENPSQFGRTRLQKLVYLLRELYQVPTGHDFSFYTYGPYSSDLMGDLDYASALGAVKVDVGDRGYQISPGEKSETYRQLAAEYLGVFKPQIDQLMQHFGHFSAKELELRATIVYAHRYALRAGRERSSEELIGQVHDVKPYFSREEIAQAYQELEHKGFVHDLVR